MSCTGSCSTDSGVKNPSTVPTLVAPGPGGGAGGVSAVGCATGAEGVVSVNAVSDCGGERRSIGGDPGPKGAAGAPRAGPLLGGLSPPLPPLFAPRPPPGSSPRGPPPGAAPRAAGKQAP